MREKVSGKVLQLSARPGSRKPEDIKPARIAGKYPTHNKNNEKNELPIDGVLMEYPVQASTELWMGNGQKPGAARVIYIIGDPNLSIPMSFGYCIMTRRSRGRGGTICFQWPRCTAAAQILPITRRGRMEEKWKYLCKTSMRSRMAKRRQPRQW